MHKRTLLFGSNRKARVLVVDDDPSVLSVFSVMLADEGAQCATAKDGQTALDLLKEQEFDLVISDLIMPHVDGLMLLSEIQAMPRPITTIMITGQDEYLDLALEATRQGAYDFLCKPVLKQQLLVAVFRALEYQHLLMMNQNLTRRLANPPVFRNLVGRSPAMLELFRVISQVARTKANILINGEMGSGIECVARAIHAQSDRKRAPFAVIDCSSIPEALMEVALFGQESTMVPGMVKEEVGLLQSSDGGTVLFNSIEELSPPLQEMVLKIVQNRSYVPLGATEAESVDLRIIAGSYQNLKAKVEAGVFSEDLYRRLNVIPVQVPTLRQRPEDVRELAQHFIDLLQEGQLCVSDISPQAIEHLMRYSWPGNVRELRNVIAQALRVCSGERIVTSDLPEHVRECLDIPFVQDDAQNLGLESWTTFLSRMKRDYFSRLLLLHCGNVSKAAESAGISRKVLYRLLKDSDIAPLSFRVNS